MKMMVQPQEPTMAKSAADPATENDHAANKNQPQLQTPEESKANENQGRGPDEDKQASATRQHQPPKAWPADEQDNDGIRNTPKAETMKSLQDVGKAQRRIENDPDDDRHPSEVMAEKPDNGKAG